jgi:hypothetical protein
VKLKPPKGPSSIRKKAQRDIEKGKRPRRKTSGTRSRAVSGALKRESRSSTSRGAISQQAKRSAARRGKRARSVAAQKAARTRKAA